MLVHTSTYIYIYIYVRTHTYYTTRTQTAAAMLRFSLRPRERLGVEEVLDRDVDFFQASSWTDGAKRLLIPSGVFVEVPVLPVVPVLVEVVSPSPCHHFFCQVPVVWFKINHPLYEGLVDWWIKINKFAMNGHDFRHFLGSEQFQW